MPKKKKSSLLKKRKLSFLSFLKKEAKEKVEETKNLALDFHKLFRIVDKGYEVLPVVVQDISSKEVLMVGYANKEAIEEALKRKLAVFFSTSRGKLWIKGEESGNFLPLKEIRVNCEQNSLLYLVDAPSINACHTQRRSCFYRKIQGKDQLEFINFS